MNFRIFFITLFLLVALVSSGGRAYGQDLRQVQDPELRMQLEHALRSLRSQLAEMPTLDRSLTPAKRGDDSLDLGGIAGQIHGIAETDSAWVLAIAAHLPEDPTAWALGEVQADGSYLITGLKRGVYLVMAGAPGYLAQFFSRAYSIWEAHPVDVPAPEIMQGIDFFLDPSEPGEGSISGRIIDAADESPIPKAYIYAYRIDNPFFSASTYSNDDGSYTLANLRSGDYVVYASAEGYFEGGYDDPTGSGRVLVTVVDGEDTGGIDFRLNRGGSISGRVVDGNGDPIAGATVETYPPRDGAIDPDGSYQYGWTTTGDDGRYTISGLVGGSYIVNARIYGRWFNLTRWYDNADRPEDATPVQVDFGEDTPDIDFVMDVSTETGSIAGRIATENGEAVQEASVRLESIDKPNFYYYAYAYPNADGEYVLNNVPAGTYRVVLEYWTQWFYNILWYDGAANPEDATPVEVVANQRVENIDFNIPASDGVLAGVVTDKAGKPISGAYVEVSTPIYERPHGDIRVWAYANTDKDGAFSINQIPDGEYHVSVFFCYIRECVQQWWPGSDHPEGAETVVVKEGQSDPSSVDFSLPIALGDASIAGVVKHTDGHALAGAQVSVMPYENITPGVPDYWGNQLFTMTDSSGAYSFDYLPAGTYVAHVSYWEAGGYAEQWYDGAESPGDAKPIVLVNDEARSDVDFALDVVPLYGTVAGKVSFEDGEPVRRAFVEAVGFYRAYDAAILWAYENYAVTDDDGSFSIDNLYEGEYQINIYAQGAEGVAHDSMGVNSLFVKVAGGETTVVEAVMRRQDAGPGEITGVVAGEWGEQLEIAVVQAIPTIDFGSPYFTAVTDENGVYTLADLPEGQYYIQARSPWHVTEYYDDAFDPAEAQLIDVTADQPVDGIDFFLSPLYVLTDGRGSDGYAESDQGSVIFGTVTDEAGQPLAGATVYVVDEAGRALLSVQTHADGTYEIAGIPPGSAYRLKATRVGYESRYNENALAVDAAPPLTMSGSRLEVNFSLSKSQTSTGEEDETPLPEGLSLLGNYPNPFRNRTVISLSVPEALQVDVTIYDALGREVQRLYHGVLPAGSHSLPWDPSGAELSSGLYFYRISAGRQLLSGKMIYLP